MDGLGLFGVGWVSDVQCLQLKIGKRSVAELFGVGWMPRAYNRIRRCAGVVGILGVCGKVI